MLLTFNVKSIILQNKQIKNKLIILFGKKCQAKKYLNFSSKIFENIRRMHAGKIDFSPSFWAKNDNFNDESNIRLTISKLYF